MTETASPEAREAAADNRPRCVRCRRPFDTHIEDMDRPERGKVYCAHPPSNAENYIPDREHEALVARIAELEAHLRSASPATGEAGEMVERLRAYRPTDEWGEGVRHIICDEAADLIERLSASDTEAMRLRYQWAANELLACDYGDNERGQTGWRVYGWRDRENQRLIYGNSIDEAIDAALAKGGAA